ncbi:MAG: D-sedoheptulose 7-phosphate isomerase [Aquificae bacterium]|nr:D-sedoheptulose 7-phosphate isomerase [Aquificota bacterium]
MKERILTAFRESAEIKLAFVEKYAHQIEEVARLLAERLRAGGTLYLFGNGGSAADAQHIAAELVGRFAKDRPPLRAVALTTDTSVLTALGNDYGFETVFERQVEAFVEKTDAVIGISTSGRSANVVRALKRAKEKGALTVAFTGGDGGFLREVADYAFVVPSFETPRIQECHITLGHTLCELVERLVFG